MKVLAVVSLRFGIHVFQSKYLQNLQPKEQNTSTKPNDSYDISHEPSN